jgi:hypothetical protein
MKQYLLTLYKQRAIDARFGGYYDSYIRTPFARIMSALFDLRKIGE